MVNEFEPKKGFYKLFNAEEKVRLMATLNKNSYMITIFACCRQLYDGQKMQGYFSKEQIKLEEENLDLSGDDAEEADISYKLLEVQDMDLKKRGSVPMEDNKGSRQNFIFIWGCRPSAGVEAETAMVEELG